MQILGLEIDGELPEGSQPVEVLVIVKCLVSEVEDFPYRLVALASAGLSSWEAEGMTRWAGRGLDADTNTEEL